VSRGSAGTVATGGSLILGPSGAVLEKLIDVQYAVNSAYRQNGEWLVNDATAATMRKIRVGGGGTLDAFAWSPSPTAGMINGTPGHVPRKADLRELQHRGDGIGCEGALLR